MNKEHSFNLLIVEDSPDICHELDLLLKADPRFDCVFFASSVAEVTNTALPPFDVVLLDLQLPDGNGLDVLPWLRKAWPGLKCLVFTVLADEQSILRAMSLGVDGYVLKDDPQLPDKIVSLLRDEHPVDQRMTHYLIKHLKNSPGSDLLANAEVAPVLNKRERDTLRCLYQGLRYSEIADHLNVSPATVPGYIKSLYKKLKVSSRGQAVFKGLEHKLL